jgi:hypothetical protein
MTNPTGTKLNEVLELPKICEFCGKVRARKPHPACSKARQAKYAQEQRHA